MKADRSTPIQFLSVAIAMTALAFSLAFLQSCSSPAEASTGPNGGDVVLLADRDTKAEVLANSDTGEVMIHTWDTDLKKPNPLEAKALILGSGSESVVLDPHPLPTDPSGRCSRFYGQANWMMGGEANHGFVAASGQNAEQYHFDWKNCWNGGEANGSMWSGMGEHRRGMGSHKGHGGHGNQ